jgi:CRP/FNR family transcriptional regulator
MPFDTRPVFEGPADILGWTGSLHSLTSPAAGKTLFEAGTPAKAIYLVRSGCLKAYTLDEEGNERVRAFFLPGDVIGLDALGVELYPATVVAVSASQVVRLRVAEMRELLVSAPATMQRLLERMSRDLASALALAGDYTAEQRVAAFLVSMSQRLGGATSVQLPMTRRDIASYLRLATETVCRVLTKFEGTGQIVSENKTVRMTGGAMLRALAEPMNRPALQAA